MTVSKRCWASSVGEGRLGEGAAAGWFVVVGIVEVDTDGPLSGGSPDPGSAPLGCSAGEGDAEIKLQRGQLITFLQVCATHTVAAPQPHVLALARHLAEEVSLVVVVVVVVEDVVQVVRPTLTPIPALQDEDQAVLHQFPCSLS